MNRRLFLPAVALAFAAVAGLSACTAQTTTAESAAAPTPSATPKLTSQQVQQQAVAKCLNESGWGVTYEAADNSIRSSIPTSQESKYNADVTRCNEPYAKDQVALSDLSQAQWKDLYGQETKTAACLRALGVEVPQIPAYQTFVDRYQSTDPWLSYSYIGTPDESTYNGYLAKCPQPYLEG